MAVQAAIMMLETPDLKQNGENFPFYKKCLHFLSKASTVTELWRHKGNTVFCALIAHMGVNGLSQEGEKIFFVQIVHFLVKKDSFDISSQFWVKILHFRFLV